MVKNSLSGMDNVKHKHHYVPRRYLRAWSKNGDDVIYVRIGSGCPMPMNINGVGFGQGYYSYEKLNFEILRSVLCCKPRSRLVTDNMMRELFFHTIVIQIFCQLLIDPLDKELVKMWRLVEDSNLIDSDRAIKLEHFCSRFKGDKIQLIEFCQRYTREGYENIISNIESKAWPILDSMKEGDLRWLKDDESAINMFYYIFTQRMRSPAFDKVSKDFYGFRVSNDFIKGGSYRRHILALDSAGLMMELRDKFSFRILSLPSEEEFITGDLPVICINQQDEGDYYFPLSPKAAFLFGPCMDFEKRNEGLLKLSHGSAMYLNNEIATNAVRQVYASDIKFLV